MESLMKHYIIMSSQNTFSQILTEETVPQHTPWKGYEKFTFRAAAVFVLLICLPFSTHFYNNLLRIEWAEFNWNTLGGLATGFGAPEFVKLAFEDIWALYSYINVFLTAVLAFFIAAVWSLVDRKTTEYRVWYHWILIIARYRLAFGIIAWGYKKFIPIQMELPSISFLYTPFADFSEQKLYWQSVGITQGYEIFLGFAEVLCGVLLLFRKTTAIGAALTAVILVNIVIANHVYDGMVHVHSFIFAVLAGIILWQYLPDIWNLLVNERDVKPAYTRIDFNKPWAKNLRLGLKSASIAIFVFFLLFLHAIDDLGYRYPHNHPGLKNSAGFYHVTEYKRNNKIIPYSPLDSVRWHDVVFETWSTLAIRLNRLQHMDIENTGKETKESISKRFEFRGVGGGRHYFDYKADTVQQVMYLTNKNKAHWDQKQVLHYSRPTDTRIILWGINEFNDSIHVVLDKAEHTYPLYEGRKKEVTARSY
jgi:hypothetical protein